MKQTLKNIDVKNKKVIVRVDYNVPLNEKFEVADDERIQRTIPTIKYLLENEASIILISHLGRPKGKYMSKMSLFPVVKHLSDLLNINVKFLKNDCFSEETHKGVAGLKKREICLLENLRFRPEEDGKNLAGIKDEIAMNKFAKKMASMGDIFVQDAFGILHRRQASTIGIVKYVNEVCIGFLVENELKFLDNALKTPSHPFVLVLGGAKVADKINVIHNLINKVDIIIIGGAMAYTFLAAQGIQVGTSIVETTKIPLAKKLLSLIKEKQIQCYLPIDHIIVNNIDYLKKNYDFLITKDNSITDKSMMGVDIGPKSIKLFSHVIHSAKTILWNGPLGVFEIDKFAEGTIAIAEAIANISNTNRALSIIGGGDSSAAIKKANVSKFITHISTGGGASLAFLAGEELPGLKVIPDTCIQ